MSDRIRKAGRRIAACAGLLLLPAAALAAQHVTIDGTTLTLGAPKARVLGEAGTQFNLRPGRASGTYFLYPKTKPLDPQQRTAAAHAAGSLRFSSGHLVRVTRDLGSFRSADGVAAMRRLIKAFAGAPNQGGQPSVHTDAHMAGEASTTRVYFTYPDRVIQIAIFEPADTATRATIDITEQYALAGHRAAE